MGTVRDNKLGGLRFTDFRGQKKVGLLERQNASIKTVSSQRTAVGCG